MLSLMILPSDLIGRNGVIYTRFVQWCSRIVSWKQRKNKLSGHFWSWQRHILQWVKSGRRIRLLHWFRQYSALAVVVSSVFAVTGTNVAALHSESIPGSILGENLATGSFSNRLARADEKDNITTSPMATASTAVETISEKTTDASSIASISPDQFAVTAQQSPVLKDPEEDGGVTIYTVVEGDTVSSIAAHNHITVNTILWANDMDNVDSIRPGDQIFILPVAGLTYTVKAGDTIESIAKQFQADGEKIIAYNNLPANGRLESSESIIIPDGRRAEEPIVKPASTGITPRQYVNQNQTDLAVDLGTKTITSAKAGKGHRFPYGYCTWYVSQKRYVPWSGNAGAWLFNARSMGYSTGKSPRAGSIMVTTESRAYGHVALVEKVNGDGTITVSEMNYNAWGKVDRRVVPVASRFIKGYIY
jgi:surface antigen/LysM repeat protein